MTVRRMIFVLSPGRCGTMFLARMMTTVPDMSSWHEPEPTLHDHSRLARSPKLNWLKLKKLPHIFNRKESVYLETSNQFMRGWPELFVYVGMIPDVIVLRRDFRETALSMWRMHYTPVRSITSERYGIRPDDNETILRIGDISGLTDYQLCYWHCLEVEERSKKYAKLLADNGSCVYETHFNKITVKGELLNLIRAMDLPDPEAKSFDRFVTEGLNKTVIERADVLPDGDLDEQEEQVESLL